MITHSTRYRVIYGDTDNMGMAYHANYFRWFEIGRAEMFRHLGLTYREIEASGIFLPLAECHCKFVAPVRYDDLITIETTLDPVMRAGIKFDYQICGPGTERPLARGYTKHACVDTKGRVVRPPAMLTNLIRAAQP
jgi:acyl-CoA thioester hydrolase